MKTLRFGRKAKPPLPVSKYAVDEDTNLSLPPNADLYDYESPDEVRAALGLERETRRPASE